MNAAELVERSAQGILDIGLADAQDSGILPGRGEKFFPVVGYPPLTMFGPMDDEELFRDLDKRPEYPLLGYLHTPFCPMRCSYCHWITIQGAKDDAVDTYIDYLEKEMAIYFSRLGRDRVPVRSVLWGGGTPTYPKARQMERMLKLYRRYHDLSACDQFSVESDPGSLCGQEGLDRLRVMKDHGVDRISLGAQALYDDILRHMRRKQTWRSTLESIENIRKVGIPIVYIDLIYGYPNITLRRWAETLLRAMEMDIEGYQIYRLRIRRHGDRAGHIVGARRENPDWFPEIEDVYRMKWMSIHVGEEYGFTEYHTRLFARGPEHISKYLEYWQNQLNDVIGFGVSSWNNLRGVFSFNVGDDTLQKYYGMIDEGRLPIDRGKVRTLDDEARRSFIVPIKNNRVDKRAYTERTGVDMHAFFGETLVRMKALGMIEEDDTHIWLTQRGRFFVDEVCQQFFEPKYAPFPEVFGLPPRDEEDELGC